MIRDDLFNNINVKRVLSPSAGPTDNTAQVGQVVDHQGYDSVTYLISTGTLGTGAASFTVLLEEGDAANLSDAAAVSDADLLGTEALASFAGTDDDKCFKLGYRGSKRYSRLTITPASNALAAPMSAVCVLGALDMPAVNPPA